MPAPQVVALDVNQTVSDPARLGPAFAAVGAPDSLADLWFCGVLRDGIALSVTGVAADFAVLAQDSLRRLLEPLALRVPLDVAVTRLIDTFTELPPHHDIGEGIRGLRAAGVRVVTLSNGGPEVAQGLLERAGARDEVERVMSATEFGAWKPAPAAYTGAAAALGVPVEHLLMVAVHPWDLEGASRAGLATAWLDRADQARYPSYLRPPDLRIRSLTELPALAGLQPGSPGTVGP